MTSTTDLQAVTDESGDLFPYSGMRLMSVMQVNVGILVFVLGVVDLVQTNVLHDNHVQIFGSAYESVVTLTVVSAPLWCGLWFCITGAFGASLSRYREPSLLCCKIGYLLLNVMSCALFGPACAVLSGYIFYTRHKLDMGDYQWLISLVVCFLAVIELLLSAVSVSIGCCCSTLRPTQIHACDNPCNTRNTEGELPSSRKDHSLSCPVCGGNNTSSNNNGRGVDNPPFVRCDRINVITTFHPLGRGKATDSGGSHRADRQLNGSHDLEYSRDLFGAMYNYSVLKKWALPRL